MEYYFSGMCRSKNAPRLVMVEEDNGEWDIGCDVLTCENAAGCPTGQQIRALLGLPGASADIPEPVAYDD